MKTAQSERRFNWVKNNTLAVRRISKQPMHTSTFYLNRLKIENSDTRAI